MVRIKVAGTSVAGTTLARTMVAGTTASLITVAEKTAACMLATRYVKWDDGATGIGMKGEAEG